MTPRRSIGHNGTGHSRALGYVRCICAVSFLARQQMLPLPVVRLWRYPHTFLWQHPKDVCIDRCVLFLFPWPCPRQQLAFFVCICLFLWMGCIPPLTAQQPASQLGNVQFNCQIVVRPFSSIRQEPRLGSTQKLNPCVGSFSR